MITKRVKIKSIQIIIDEEYQAYSVKYKFDHNYKHSFVDGDSARLVARILTKEANKFWSKMDAAYAEGKLKEEK